MMHFKPKHSRLPKKIVDMIAHDIKIPLDGLADNIAHFKEVQQPNRPSEELFSELALHVNSTRKLLDQILSWSKLFITNDRDIRQPVLIKLQIDFILQSVKYISIPKDLSILNLVPGFPQIRINLPVFEFVLRNLLVHSIRECEHSGTIEIRLRTEKKAITVYFRNSGPYLRSDLKKYPGALTHVSPDEKRTTIDMCADLLHMYGGKIWAETPPEVGPTFYFSIPIGSE